MKNCINCGAQIDESNKFCPHCGTKCESYQEAEILVHQSADSLSEDGQPAYSDTTMENSSETPPSSDQYPMKWHNFQMVVMILGGISSVGIGLATLMGSAYLTRGINSDMVYYKFPGLKGCDIFYGIVLIALGVFEFIVRNRLCKFKANGPSSLKTLYVLSIIGILIYIGWASSATGINLFTSKSDMGSMIGSVLFMIINSIYYSKRSSLFIN